MLKRMVSGLVPTTVMQRAVTSCILLLLVLTLSLVACAGPTPTPTPTPEPKPSGPIKAEWIEPQVDGNTVSIPVNEIEKNWNIHFKLKTQGGNNNFMAYIKPETCPRPHFFCRKKGLENILPY